MMIPILPQLESREQWIAFFQRERPYAQIRQPNCRVDLQTTYLQITCFGTQPVRFTLGSKTTLEPVWQIISRCHWSLSNIIDGLEGLEDGRSVRDRGVSDWSPDLSVRRSIPREQQLYPEESLGTWAEPSRFAKNSAEQLCALIAWGKIEDWQSDLTPMQWLLQIEGLESDLEVKELSDSIFSLAHPALPSVQFRAKR